MSAVMPLRRQRTPPLMPRPADLESRRHVPLLRGIQRAEAVLGRGSFGIVRVGTTAHGRRVALKTFGSEADAARELAVLGEIILQPHPGLVGCLGECVVDGAPCAVLELMPGGSLDRALRRYRLPERWWRRYLMQLTGALAHLHSLGVMHLDVKAGNLLLSTAQPELTSVVKLADFGESLRVGGPTGATKGTVSHMSPDAAVGQTSTACDVWSLAVVGLEVVHGGADEWWRAEHGECYCSMYAGAMIAARRAEPPAVSENLHPLTQSFLRSCLQIDPSDRPSAAELTRHEWFAAGDERFDGGLTVREECPSSSGCDWSECQETLSTLGSSCECDVPERRQLAGREPDDEGCVWM